MHLEQGRVIVVGSSRYHIQDVHISTSPVAVKRLVQSSELPFILTTAIAWEKAVFRKEDFDSVCNQYRQQDDVWCPEFTTLTIILRKSPVACKIKIKNAICVNVTDVGVPAGPLVIERRTGHIFLVSRLFPDTNLAFISPTVPTLSSKPTFRALEHQDQIEVAVPSRLYRPQTSTKPLAGLRFAVKDSIALKGLKTGFGSQAWQDTCEAEKSTAPCVQHLIDAGAIVVGKVISSEFCEGVEPAEWIQGICPYNPRGDGFQKPSSSSTGSAVAAASYPWLDFTVGTDTGGSIRHPAGVNGLFGQRPTPAKVDMKGVLGATDLFNTVGIFARSPRIFRDVGSCLTGTPKLPMRIPPDRRYRLICPTRSLPDINGLVRGEGRWFPHAEADLSAWTAAELMIEKMVSRLESLLDCSRTVVDIYEFWAATAPKGQSKCLDKATGKIYGDITTSAACANGIDHFLARYRALNNDNDPPMSDVVKARLQYGRSLANDEIEKALEATALFKQWMETTFFELDSDETSTTTIVVFPQSLGTPDYRDDKSRWDGNLFIESFSVYALGYLCGCPDYTIPVGELPFHSRLTDQIEHLPVSCSLVGKSGTDGDLFDIVDRLHDAGIIANVQPGRRMYADSIT